MSLSQFLFTFIAILGVVKTVNSQKQNQHISLNEMEITNRTLQYKDVLNSAHR